MPKMNTTTSLNDWSFQDSHVERLLDNAAYTSAHPDDTLVLAGPARYNATTGTLSPNALASNATTFTDSLLAIGMMQSFSASQQKPVQPVMAIGSGRQFFVSGKSQVSWSIQRLFVNGRNLTRVLYTQAKQAGIDVSQFDDPASIAPSDGSDNFYVNLDSELFLIPFGMACFFRDKTHGTIGAFYMELCMISSWSIGANAGGNMIAESVTGFADRILPIVPTTGAGPRSSYPTQSTLDSDFFNSTASTPNLATK